MSYTEDDNIFKDEIEPEVVTVEEEEEAGGGEEEPKGSESEAEVEVDEEDEEDDGQYELDDNVEVDDIVDVEDELNEIKTVKGKDKDGTNVPQNNDYKLYDEGEISESESSSDESEEDEYISKVDSEKKIEYIRKTHTQEISKTYEEMSSLTNIIRVKSRTEGEDIIVDENHKTVPILTKYEKTRILGLRVSQLNEGAPRYISVNKAIIDNYIIAEKELRLKKLPFIITRPLPNGEKEHWRLKDLEIL